MFNGFQNLENSQFADALAQSLDESFAGVQPITQKEFLKNLPRVKGDSEGVSNECGICLEEFTKDDEQVLHLPCNHYYHDACGV